MRKIYPMALLLVFMQTADAQNKGHFTVSLGCGPVSSGLVFGQFTGPQKSYIQTYTNSYSPIIMGTARYFVSNRCDIGLTLAYQEQGGVIDLYTGGNSVVTAGKFHEKIATVAAEVCLTYGPKYHKRYRLYTCAGVGYRYSDKTGQYQERYYTQHSYYVTFDRPWYHHESVPNIYYSPIGASIGGKLSAYAELGIGYKGIVNGGVMLTL